jgi:23S rRNA pseudouridine1911/1915/1917 synthase
MDHADIGDLKERILYEDNHLIAVAKRSSEIVQGDKSGDISLLEMVREYIRISCAKKGNVFLGLPHRLDRPTSGAVLFARTGKALSRLSVMFRDRDIRKVYWAAVDSPPEQPEGRLEHLLVRSREKNKSFAFTGKNPPSEAKSAALSYRIIGRAKTFTILEIELETGRHHQIRAQLEAVGVHIKGDLKYGAARSNPGGGICLHARLLEFRHPVTGAEITVTAPLPPDPVWDCVR